MHSTVRTGLILLCLLAGGEAARISASTALAAATRMIAAKHHTQHGRSYQHDMAEGGRGVTQKTMDLDWPGCAKKSGFWANHCADTEGCAVQPIWLDTPRQKCRFMDEFKLRPAEVPRFLPVELKRLEEKTATFAKHGCLFGGWWVKCYRRMRQIVRLLKYVRQAVEEAKADPSHPAHTLASSGATTEALQRAADNLATGFEKHEAGKEHGAKFGEAFQKLKDMPETLREAAEIADSNKASLSAEEKDAMEKTASVEAMLAVTNTKINDEQRAELFARIEAGEGSDMEKADDLDEAVDMVTAQTDGMFQASDKEDLEGVQDQERQTDDEEDDVEDKLAKDDDDSLLQLEDLGARASGNASQLAHGTGPLKWLFKNGLGWIVTRVAWLVLFLIGAALGIIRAAVIFPLLFVSCTLTKFLVWLFRDVGYNLLWEGETKQLGTRFKRIGKCAPWMWEAVGFNASAKDVAAQVVVQPAQFASQATGVHHLYKSEKQLCDDVRCGSNARCHAGQCYCLAGYYPEANGTDCVTAVTTAGCRCLARWEKKSLAGLFSKTHYGCALGGVCKVDMQDPSWSACKKRLITLAARRAQRDKLKRAGLKGASDTCERQPFEAAVPAVPAVPVAM
mmetsp:Transcript_116923/g.325855  ORF Transcript_116923/g.325855 Transcript_116923/m.325855 type:complete len:622 (-) Transcript_116923:115-1980(-)